MPELEGLDFIKELFLQVSSCLLLVPGSGEEFEDSSVDSEFCVESWRVVDFCEFAVYILVECGCLLDSLDYKVA